MCYYNLNFIKKIRKNERSPQPRQDRAEVHDLSFYSKPTQNLHIEFKSKGNELSG